MATFEYTARADPSRTLEGTIEAESIPSAAERLRAQGLYPIRVEASARGTSRWGWLTTPGRLGRVGLAALAEMTEQLADLLEAGIPLERALRLQAQHVSRASLKTSLDSLVESVCRHCRRPVAAQPAWLEQAGVAAGDAVADRIYEPAGCSACRHTGFAGRTGIFEILRVTESIRDLIQQRVTTGTVKAAVAAGMRTLRQDGWRKVQAGITSWSEVLRVSHADELVVVDPGP